jgi:hypothetical protein
MKRGPVWRRRRATLKPPGDHAAAREVRTCRDAKRVKIGDRVFMEHITIAI